MTKLSTTKQSYDDFASEYGNLWGKEWYEPHGKRINKFLELMIPQGKLLDAGCGTGHILSYIISKGFDGYGIDMSEGMIEEAAKRVSKKKLQVMSLISLRFPDDTFDGITSCFVLNHVEEIKKAIEELSRVTKSKGYAYVSTHISDKNKSFETWQTFPGGGNYYMYYRDPKIIYNLFGKNKFKIIEKELTNGEREETKNLQLFLQKS